MPRVLRTAVGAPQPTTNAVLPQIKLYDDDNFDGDELDMYGGGTHAIGADVSNGWNDDVSSVIVIAGVWELFTDIDYGGRKLTLMPGVYPSIEQAGLGNVEGATAEPPGPGWNDKLSSLRGRWS